MRHSRQLIVNASRAHRTFSLPLAVGLVLVATSPLVAQEQRCPGPGCSETRREANSGSERQEIERLRRELQAITLQLVSGGDTLDARRMRSLRQRLSMVVRDLERAELRAVTEERIQQRLEAAGKQAETQRKREEAAKQAEATARAQAMGGVATPAPPRPTVAPRGRGGAPSSGYMGVSITMVHTTEKAPNGEPLWVFQEYPRIEAVDPGSPAQRAGLIAGDIIVAIDGRDVKRGVTPFPQLLRPGTELPLTIRRGGRTQSLTVAPVARVEEAPRPRMEPTRVDAPRAPRPPTWQSDPAGLAGARLEPIRGELRDYFGVSRGLLVIGVGAGTPAARAQLRGGDVIVAAGDREIESLRDLRDAMMEASNDESSLPLSVVRKGEKVRVVLSWK